jgi:hypothetical protein
MTSNDTNIGARNPVPPPASPLLRRHSTAVVIAVGLVGLVLGAIAAFAITGLVWTVRVEFPPPPYPPPLSSMPGCVSSPPTAPTPAPGLVPAPPLPPLPRG